MTVASITDAKRSAWRRGLRVSKNERPKACLANALQVLAMHPDWEGVIAYDAFAESIVCRKEPPTRKQDAPGYSMIGDWTEEHSARTAAWLASEADFDATTNIVDQAVSVVSKKQIVHPVREYLAALEWDGTPRLDFMLSNYFGTADTPYTRVVGSRWMISAVARVMRPGCQVDSMIVLEGKQGERKSTGLEALCERPEWFADTGVTIGEKDSYQSLRRKWIYEFGELDSIKGREVTKVKNFVSARSDNFRPSYGVRNRDFPRQVVFAGTTNEENYLPDRTGNRRYLPVRVQRRVDVDAIRRDRGQLWAEARVRYEQGEPWHMDTPELVRLCETEQADRLTPDDWEPIVRQWLDSPSVPDAESSARDPVRHRLDLSEGITTAQALLGAIHMRPADINPAASTRMGRVLRECGYEPTPNPVWRGDKRVRVYMKKSGPEVSQ